MHKSQLASDRTSCRSPSANQVRLVLHTAAFWLMLALRDAVPKSHQLSNAVFAFAAQPRPRHRNCLAHPSGPGRRLSRGRFVPPSRRRPRAGRTVSAGRQRPAEPDKLSRPVLFRSRLWRSSSLEEIKTSRTPSLKLNETSCACLGRCPPAGLPHLAIVIVGVIQRALPARPPCVEFYSSSCVSST